MIGYCWSQIPELHHISKQIITIFISWFCSEFCSQDMHSTLFWILFTRYALYFVLNPVHKICTLFCSEFCSQDMYFIFFPFTSQPTSTIRSNKISVLNKVKYYSPTQHFKICHPMLHIFSSMNHHQALHYNNF
jgi:hypothetical protein